MVCRVLTLLSIELCCLLSPRTFAQAAELLSGTVHYQFREPRLAGYRVERAAGSQAKASSIGGWITAWPENGSSNAVQFGSRIVLRLHAGEELSRVLQGHRVTVAREVGPLTYILQAADPSSALNEAQSLAEDPRVLVAYPVARRPKQLFGPYAPRPNDPLFFRRGEDKGGWQANLENRDPDGLPAGPDLNVRAAWPFSSGEGVLVGVGDDGIELDHPDLVEATRNAPHFNFVSSSADGRPMGSDSSHGTAVAGLVAASRDNRAGISGVAPYARVASWVIFGADYDLISDEALMDMFQYQSNIVSVQSHSWGKAGDEQYRLAPLEEIGLSNAVTFGRSGLGVVIVRAGGNGREDRNDANEDGYVADSRVIGVAAVRLDGKVARYSTPGACLLVGAPSGDLAGTDDPCLTDSPALLTTDRQGELGYNREASPEGDYSSALAGFSGTSAAAPQVAGVAALILAANPKLGYRDVQQILLNASRHYDFSDPTLSTNGAGYRVSHNIGFGIPDAGRAVALARMWSNRPPVVTFTYAATNSLAIPDQGFRLGVAGPDVPSSISSLIALPGGGRHPETTTALLPLVDVGAATERITEDLRGKAALIRRGESYFCEKLAWAALAGAELAVVYNNTGGDSRVFMAETDLSPIAAMFISQDDGEALRDYLAAVPEARVQAVVQSATYTFEVPDTLQCEHVAVRVDTSHSARADLRIVLTSPMGTRSVLQRLNSDLLPGPNDWTYYSVQHFYESSFGTWTLNVLDEDAKGTGSVNSVSLILSGVPISDSDHDGLDDGWELRFFQTLAYGPAGDPDHDGYSNAQEQIFGTNPNGGALPFPLDLSLWDARLARLSWPSNTNAVYRVRIGPESVGPLTLATNILGQFPETEWFVPYTNLLQQFFELQAVPRAE